MFRFHYFPQLDGLRGLAVLLVLIGHWAQFSGNQLLAGGGSFGQLGVLLFFVLSGFLITGLLLREREDTGNIDLRAFYVRRVLRLGPALLLFLATVAILVKAKLINNVPVYEFAACLLYVRNIFGRSQSVAHLWSLSLEEQFYTLWPWALTRIPPRRLFTFAALATGLIGVTRTLGIVLHWASYERGIFYERPWFRFDSILGGCCVAAALTDGNGAARMAIAIVQRIHPAAAWGALLAWTYFGERLSRPSYISVQVLLSVLVLTQLAIPAKVPAAFSNPWLRFFGRISYSLYLWQQLFLVVQRPSWGMLRAFPWNFIIPIGCALASFYGIEKPVLTLKKRWERTLAFVPRFGVAARLTGRATPLA